MKTLVFGVIYLGVEPYLSKYFESLVNQTNKEFDILIIEDGLQLPNYFNQANLIIRCNDSNFTPAELRNSAIEFAQENNYDILILTDCDDYFSPNRIAETIHTLNEYDFCANRLVPVDEFGNILVGVNFTTIPSKIIFDDILKNNFLGMTNTALKVDSIPQGFYIPNNSIAVDWWIFSILLLDNKTFSYIDTAVTYYRQHINSLIGIKSELDKNALLFGIKVKLTHYTNLLFYLEKINFTEHTSEIIKELNELEKLKILLQDEKFQNQYISLINSNIDKFKKGWWSNILSLSDFERYN